MWFQHTMCHTADTTMDILHQRFEGMIISCRSGVNWPPRSCDLTQLDFFLWGFLKSHVYAILSQSTDALKVNITTAQILCGSYWKLDHSDLCHCKELQWTFEYYIRHNGILNEKKRNVFNRPTSYTSCFIPFQNRPALIGKPVTRTIHPQKQHTPNIVLTIH